MHIAFSYVISPYTVSTRMHIACSSVISPYTVSTRVHIACSYVKPQYSSIWISKYLMFFDDSGKRCHVWPRSSNFLFPNWYRKARWCDRARVNEGVPWRRGEREQLLTLSWMSAWWEAGRREWLVLQSELDHLALKLDIRSCLFSLLHTNTTEAAGQSVMCLHIQHLSVGH